MSTGSPRQLWLLPVLLITVIATALGGLFARDLYAPAPPATPVAVQPTPTVVPLDEQPGSPVVRPTADAAAHPLFGVLHPVLQAGFDAINAKDYERWADTVTAERRALMPKAQWRDEYGTSRDGNIVVYRIEAGSGPAARVLLRFTSTQHPSKGPPDMQKPCIEWNVVWNFAIERGEWRMAAGISGRTPQYIPCPGA